MRQRMDRGAQCDAPPERRVHESHSGGGRRSGDSHSLEEILREEGYGVATAATAAEALVLLQDAPYDVVLLDIWLPDRDGLDVLAEIHALAPGDAAGSGDHQRPRHH